MTKKILKYNCYKFLIFKKFKRKISISKNKKKLKNASFSFFCSLLIIFNLNSGIRLTSFAAWIIIYLILMFEARIIWHKIAPFKGAIIT